MLWVCVCGCVREEWPTYGAYSSIQLCAAQQTRARVIVVVVVAVAVVVVRVAAAFRVVVVAVAVVAELFHPYSNGLDDVREGVDVGLSKDHGGEPGRSRGG